MATNIDVLIKASTALLPLCINVWGNGQGLERGAIQPLEQITAAGTEMAGDLAIKLIQQGPDGGVHLSG
jgi:hypothetical protein